MKNKKKKDALTVKNKFSQYKLGKKALCPKIWYKKNDDYQDWIICTLKCKECWENHWVQEHRYNTFKHFQYFQIVEFFKNQL